MENVAAQNLLFHRSHPSTRSVPRFSFSSGCCILDGSPAATTIGRRLSRMANQCVANGSPWSGQRKFRKLSPSNESGGGIAAGSAPLTGQQEGTEHESFQHIWASW